MEKSARKKILVAVAACAVLGAAWFGFEQISSARVLAESRRALVSSSGLVDLDQDGEHESVIIWKYSTLEEVAARYSIIEAFGEGGQKLWESTIPPQRNVSSRVESIASCADTLVVVSNVPGKDTLDERTIVVVGLDPASGAQRWKRELASEASIGSFAAHCVAGLVHVHVLPVPLSSSKRATWFAIDPGAGETRWEVAVSTSAMPPALFGEGKLVTYGNDRGVVVDIATGEARALPKDLDHVALHEGTLYATSWDDEVSAVILGTITEDTLAWRPRSPTTRLTGPLGFTKTHILGFGTGALLAVPKDATSQGWRVGLPTHHPASRDSRSLFAPERAVLGDITGRYLPLATTTIGLGRDDRIVITIIDTKEGALTWQSKVLETHDLDDGATWRANNAYWIQLSFAEDDTGWLGFDSESGKILGVFSPWIRGGENHNEHLGATSVPGSHQARGDLFQDHYWDSYYIARPGKKTELVFSQGWPVEFKDRSAEIEALLGTLP